MDRNALVKHIPHSRTLIPSKYRENFLLSDGDLRAIMLRLTDWYTEELFTDDESEVISEVSRIVCGKPTERFWTMNLGPPPELGWAFYTSGLKANLVEDAE